MYKYIIRIYHIIATVQNAIVNLPAHLELAHAFDCGLMCVAHLHLAHLLLAHLHLLEEVPAEWASSQVAQCDRCAVQEGQHPQPTKHDCCLYGCPR